MLLSAHRGDHRATFQLQQALRKSEQRDYYNRIYLLQSLNLVVPELQRNMTAVAQLAALGAS